MVSADLPLYLRLNDRSDELLEMWASDSEPEIFQALLAVLNHGDEDPLVLEQLREAISKKADDGN